MPSSDVQEKTRTNTIKPREIVFSGYSLLGLLLAALIWILDPLLHARFVHGTDALQAIIHPSIYEIYSRTAMPLLVVIFAAIGRYLTLQTSRLAAERRSRVVQRQTIIDALPALISYVDSELRYQFNNAAFYAWLGKTEDSIIGRAVREVVSDAVYDDLQAHFARALRGEQVSFEHAHRDHDNRTASFDVKLLPDISPDNKVLGFYILSVDASELKRQEARFEMLFEAMPSALLLNTPSGGILMVNQAAVSLFGYGKETLRGLKIEELMPERFRSDHVRHREKYNENMTERVMGEDLHLFGLHRDGHEFPIETRLTPVVFDDATLILTTIVDISRRMQAEEDQKSLREQLVQAQKMEAVGQLTGGIAHDFNNLLGVVMGNMELVKRMADRNDAKATEYIDNVLHGVRRGATLTQRLLAFSRKQILSPEVVDLNALIREMEDMLQRTLGEIIEIEVVSAGGLWPCYVDKSQVENVVLNFAINARDAMPGGGKLTIETANIRLDDAYCAKRADVSPGQYVMLAVTDTGTGITKDALARVFEPFFTTKGAGQGSGLGLSMAYGFAKQSHGHINIYSEVGEGTSVKFYLPRTTETGERKVVSTEADSETRGTEVILVVEDHPDLLELYVVQLESLGYRALPAKDGHSALEVFDSHKAIDLLLTDVILAGDLSGRQVATAITGRNPSIKVLYMSGYTENAVVHQGRLDTGTELLRKPFTMAELSRMLRKLLDQGRQERRLEQSP